MMENYEKRYVWTTVEELAEGMTWFELYREARRLYSLAYAYEAQNRPDIVVRVEDDLERVEAAMRFQGGSR